MGGGGEDRKCRKDENVKGLAAKISQIMPKTEKSRSSNMGMLFF